MDYWFAYGFSVFEFLSFELRFSWYSFLDCWFVLILLTSEFIHWLRFHFEFLSLELRFIWYLFFVLCRLGQSSLTDGVAFFLAFVRFCFRLLQLAVEGVALVDASGVCGLGCFRLAGCFWDCFLAFVCFCFSFVACYERFALVDVDGVCGFGCFRLFASGFGRVFSFKAK